MHGLEYPSCDVIFFGKCRENRQKPVDPVAGDPVRQDIDKI